MLDRKIRYQKDRSMEIKKIEDKQARYEALVEFITPEHTDKCRWSVEAIADVANAYIEAEDYAEFLKSSDPEDRWADGQVSVLGDLLLCNGWGWVVGLW